MIQRKLASEALRTALLVTTVVGTGIMADRLTHDTALALRANTIAAGTALFMLITCLGPESGAHFNPVVTMIFAGRREIAPALALAYVLAKGTGGIVGGLVAHAMVDLPILQVSETVRTGGAQWVSEIVATFGLMLAILGGLYARANVATVVACYITAAYWFTASTSIANARSTCPAFRRQR